MGGEISHYSSGGSPSGRVLLALERECLYGLTLKAAVHWVRVNAFSAGSSPNLTWAAMGLREDSARLSALAISTRVGYQYALGC